MDFPKLVQLLRARSSAVKRLSAERHAPDNYRKAIKQLNWDTQPIILEEIMLLRDAAVQVVVALNDPDIKANWNGLPWQTVYRHAANAIAWLDKFKEDITRCLENQDPKLARSVEQYERYKLMMIKSIDDTFGLPKKPEVDYSRRDFMRTAASLIGMAAAGFAGIYTPRVWAEEPKEMAKPASIDDFTDEYAQKLMETYKTPKAVLDDKEFAGEAKVSYVTSKDGKNDFGKFLETGKDDAYIVLLCDLNSKDDLFSRRAMIAAKYAAAQTGLELKIYDVKMDDDHTILKKVSQKFGNTNISNTAFFLVSRYDVIAGETKGKNDGKLKIVDVISGGPKSNDVIDSLTRNLCKYWVPSNITTPNNEYVWRTENRQDDAPWKKVMYAQK